MNFFFNFNKKIIEADTMAEKMCKKPFAEINKVVEFNQQKVLRAFIDQKVNESHFCGTTGYGYNDRGREVLDALFAQIFSTEDALVRHNFASGTHAISTALFGILRPGDKILSITGLPYDTMHKVIGLKGKNTGSLKEFGINFDFIDYEKNEEIYFNNIKNNIKNNYNLIYIQKSKGYSNRESLSCKKIGKIIEFIKKIDENIIIFVDNCYGEFVETQEPTEVGADLIAGSLIKNAGGGIASSGGYIAGKRDLIELCAQRLTAPGVGREIGATFGHNREIFMGLFASPHIVGEALKTAIFAANLFEILGFETSPNHNEKRFDIVQNITLGSEKNLIKFCKGLQAASPVDSFVTPEPWEMPGYAERIIMAAGAFTSGSSIELSADAPIKPPFDIWLQGGLNFESAKIGILNAANEIFK